MYVCALISPVEIFMYIFIDGKCVLYVHQAEVLFLDKIKHIISIDSIQNVVSLCLTICHFN